MLILSNLLNRLHALPLSHREIVTLYSLHGDCNLIFSSWLAQLEFGEKLGKGSTGRLFKGRYLSQDVAIKIMEIDDCGTSGSDSDTHRSSPASERLQIFKQEVLIMRLVRHKNLVQFIGACSKWPKLCIVTELMAGGR